MFAKTAKIVCEMVLAIFFIDSREDCPDSYFRSVSVLNKFFVEC